jgi:hypothetical protein
LAEMERMMTLEGARTETWRRRAAELNAEFGGQHLQHCTLLNGQQFAVIPGALKACACSTGSSSP